MPKVKSIEKLLGQSFSSQDEPEQFNMRSLIKLNENGDVLKETLFNIDGEIEQENTNKYNDKGLLTHQKSNQIQDQVVEEFFYTYDKNGKRESEKIIYGDGSVSLKTVERLEKELVITILDEDGEFEGKEIHKFDDNNNILEETTWDEENIVQEKNIYIYDENQRLVLKTEYGYEEEFVSQKQIEYDSGGNPVKIASVAENGNLISLRESKYDDAGLLLEQNIDGYLIKYFYDDSGRMTREETYNKNSVLEAYVDYFYNNNSELQKSVSFQASEYFVSEPGFFPTAAATFIHSAYPYTFFE